MIWGRVLGAGKLASDLKRINRRLPSTVSATDVSVVASITAGARAQASRLGGVHRHVADGIYPVVVQRGSAVRLDVGQQPAILGAEFGGGRRSTTRQFPPWRGSGPGSGYMVFPTIREQQVFQRYIEAVDDTLGG